MYKLFVLYIVMTVLVNSSPLYLIDSVFAAGTASLQTTHVSGPASWTNGEPFTYVFSIRNDGPDDADGSSFVDTFPVGAKDITMSCISVTNGATCPTWFNIGATSASGVIPVLPYNGEVRLSISWVYAVTSPTSASNSVTARVPSGTTDPGNTHTYTTTTPIVVRPADLDTTISGPTAGIALWSPVTYTFTHTNNGPGPADGSVLSGNMRFIRYTWQVYGTVNYEDLTITCEASGGAVCPVFNSASEDGSIIATPSINTDSYSYYSLYSGGTSTPLPVGWSVTMTVNFTPVSTNIQTFCGPDYSSVLYADLYGQSRIVTGLSDPSSPNNVANHTTQGRYEEILPCPPIDLETTIDAVPTSGWNFWDTLTYVTTHTNHGPGNASGSYISNRLSVNTIGLSFGQLHYTWLTITCEASGWATCPDMNDLDQIMTSTWMVSWYPAAYYWVVDEDRPTSGSLTFTVSLIPTEYITYQTCWWSATLVLRNETYSSVPGWYTDPVRGNNGKTSLVYGPFVELPPCPEVDLETVITWSTDQWETSTPLSYTITHTNHGPDDASGSNIFGYLQNIPLPYMNYKDLTITCEASGWATCPILENTPSTSGSVIPNIGNIRWNPVYARYLYTATTDTSWPSGWSIAITVQLTPNGPYEMPSCASAIDLTPRIYWGSNPWPEMTELDSRWSRPNYAQRDDHYIISCVDLTANKIVTPSTIAPWDPMQFVLEFGNGWPSDAMDVMIEDILPSGFVYASGSCSATAESICGSIDWDPTTRTISSLIPTLKNGGLVTYTLYGNAIGYSSAWTNIVTAHTDKMIEIVPETNRAQVNFSIIGTDPQVNKTALDKEFIPWGANRYQILVRNPSNGEQILSSSITDYLPAGFEYESTTTLSLWAGATRTSVNDPVVGDTTPSWGLFSLAPGATVLIEFVAKNTNDTIACPQWHFDNSAIFDYDAEVSGEGQRGYDGTLIGNDADNILCTSQLSITKTVDQTVVTWWDTLTWMIDVYNTGALATTGVVTIQDYIHRSLSSVTVSTSSPSIVCSMAHNPLLCSISAGLPAYTGHARITISGQTNSYSTNIINNTVSYNANIPITCGEEWCSTSTEVKLARAEIYSSKIVDKPLISWHDLLTYTISVWNSGSVANSGIISVRDIPQYDDVTITDISTPAGVTCPPPWNWLPYEYMECIIDPGILTPGTSIDIIVQAQVKDTIPNQTIIRNNYYLSAPIPQDVIMDRYNNANTLYFVWDAAILLIDKSVDKTLAQAGDELNYVITVSNLGTLANTGIINVWDYPEPDKIAITSLDTPTGMICNPIPEWMIWNGNCTISWWLLLPWESIVLWVQGILNSALTNGAVIQNYVSINSDSSDDIILKYNDTVRTSIGIPVIEIPNIKANPDTLTLQQGISGTVSILPNDMVNGIPLSIDDIVITMTWSLANGITFDPNTGLFSISNSTIFWTYIYSYTICELSRPTNCDTSTVTIIVTKKSTSGWWGSYTPTTWSTTTWVIDDDIYNPSIGSTCFTPMDKKTIDQGIQVSEAFKIAHQMLYSYELTRWQGTRDYRPFDYLTREEAARFMVEFAINVLCRKPNRSYADNFTDIADANPTLISYIRKSYEYDIFHGDQVDEKSKTSTTFRPLDKISRDEIIATMVRLVTNEYNEGEWESRASHYKSFLRRYVTAQLNSNSRQDIAVTIYDLYRNNEYHMEDIGYVITY